MLFLLVGAMLAIIGIVLLAAPPIWRGRLSGGKPRAVATAATTVAGVGVQAKVTFAFESVATSYEDEGLTSVVVRNVQATVERLAGGTV